MGIFDFFKGSDINEGLKEFANIQGAVLLDVRTPSEYAGGHIPRSKNVPLQTIDKVSRVAENKDVPLFVYCQSGARSRQAVQVLRQMGYNHVENLGGISAWTGKVVR